MTCITNSACEEDVRLENFVADLTSVVYSVFLQRGLSDSWLKTELGVWKALKTAVQKWARQRPSAESSQELEAWRAGLWQDLAQCASHVAMANGVAGLRRGRLADGGDHFGLWRPALGRHSQEETSI